MYQAFYRKWRPQVFDDVCGQEHITSILKYETENNKFSHAYLFCGSRGTGKTTCAKILAKAVNCLSPVNGNPCNECAACCSIDEGTATDVLEMDAASNNGVDNIRDIRDEVVYTPSALKYRVYIVDEVHMLSGSAFNALLKTLEEPPSHAIFILATTELHKLPSTIVSRCQRYEFRRISTDALIGRLEYIAKKENIEYTQEALRIIAKMAQGGMRDAISLLELCAGNREKITPELVNETLGVGGRDNAQRIIEAIADADYDTIFEAVDKVVRSSKDLSVFWQDLITFYRDMLVIKTTKAAKSYLDLTEDETQRLLSTASRFTKETVLLHCKVLEDTLYTMQKSTHAKRTVAEMALVRMCDMSLDPSVDALAARVSKLENMLASGSFTVPAVRATAQKEEKQDNAPIETVSSVKQETPKQEQPQPHANGADTLKPIRGWMEIAQNACESDGAALGFLKNGKAYTDANGNIHIRFASSFACIMVDKPSVREQLKGALSIKLGRPVDKEAIVFGVFEGNEKESTELDELENID